ncbi:hypothetical protein [Methylobacterium longum]|uniref:Uncharacterized protein n=1 Tax=Methylobacterium longum TaxID=767694 RepID=A0ABT8AIS4_9HYPH|nr:hypothetical protein [Methylobacterium longum]MDN3569279.1 hypothetical protein [Methylobacterium longum]GJE14886.1 hypothetical protein FOHLNKBM_5963 [Methylobacterium longum]
MQAGSVRGEKLVEAWNRSDATYIIDQLSDDIILEARFPKMPVLAEKLQLTGKKKFALGLKIYPRDFPPFNIVSATEDPHTICLVLEDSDKDLLAITIELNDDGRFARIISYRSGKPKRKSR